jgi:alanine racemase
MLGACLPDEVDLAVRDDVRPSISSLSEAKAFSAAAARHHKTVAVHLKVDTGLGRLGVNADKAFALVREIQKLPALALEGVFTHFASAEEDAKFTRQQIERFRQVLELSRAAAIEIPIVHANNSAGLLHESETNFNAVRPGLLVYGVAPDGKRAVTSSLRTQLRPALSLKCRVSLVKEIAKGTSLSYGRAFIAPRRMRVATLTAGFADGYLRAGSGRAEVLIRGTRCRVLGRITMDQMLADVSNIGEVTAGDEVVLIGQQQGEQIGVNDLAKWCGTIPWEVLTNITYRVPRIYRGGQAS